MRFWPSSIRFKQHWLLQAVLSACVFHVAFMPITPVGAAETSEAGQSAPLAADSYQAFNRYAVDHVILPALADFETQTQLLDKAVVAFCQAPTEAGLEEIRGQYQKSADAWMQLSFIRFGPNVLLMRNARVHFWPDKRRQVDRQLKALLKSENVARLEPKKFAKDSVALQGLPALERLFFPEDQVKSAAFQTKPAFRCMLAQAISQNLAHLSRDLQRDWTGTQGAEHFAKALTEAGADAPHFATAQEATAALFKSAYTELQAILDLKLIAVLGPSLEKPRPFLVESALAQRTWRNIQQNIAVQKKLYGPQGKDGFRRALLGGEKGQALDQHIQSLYQDLEARLQGMETPLITMISDEKGRAEITAMIAVLRDLKNAYAGPLAEALGTPIGFNSLDGD